MEVLENHKSKKPAEKVKLAETKLQADNNIMIDIETLGRVPNAVILEIAALQFNPETGKTSKSFSVQVDKDSCLQYGLEIDDETVEWWSNQKHHYQWRMTNPVPLPVALSMLARFIEKVAGEEGLIWANGTDFDIAILRNAFSKCEIDWPYPYYNTRDVRTISKLIPEIRHNQTRQGAHVAIDDCHYQVTYLVETLNAIKK